MKSYILSVDICGELKEVTSNTVNVSFENGFVLFSLDDNEQIAVHEKACSGWKVTSSSKS